MAFGYNIHRRKTNKKNHIVSLFRQHGILSKAQTKKLSGYSMDTVLSIFSTLLEENMIIEADGAQKTKGRKAQYYSLNDKKSVYIGITFSQLGIYSTIMSFSSRIIGSLYTSLDSITTAEEFIEELKNHINQLISGKELIHNIAGFGCSVPGDINTATGILKSYMYLPFLQDFNFFEFFSALFPETRVHLGHNITGMISYLMHDNLLLRENETVLFISARSGLANGIVHDKNIVTSRGEFSHISVSDNGPECSCGRKGCLDVYFSFEKFMNILYKTSSRKTTPHTNSEIEDLEKLSYAYKTGDQNICDELDKALAYFAHALLDMVNVIAPDLVILSGELLKVYGDPVPKICSVIECCFADTGVISNFKKTHIEFIDIGTEIASRGICYTMLHKDWDFYEEN